MWLFITARLRRWLLFALLVPIATTLLHLVRTSIEKRSGSTPLVRGLTKLEEFGQSKRSRT